MEFMKKAERKMVSTFDDVKKRVTNLREKGLKKGFSEFVNNLIIFAFALGVAAIILIPVWNKIGGSGDNTMDTVDSRMKQLIDAPAAEADKQEVTGRN